MRTILFSLCLMLLFASSSFAASTDSPIRRGAVDQSKAEAASLLDAGKAEQAYTLYMRLMREAPDDDAVNLGLARSAAKAGKYNQAVMAYETLLEKYPREAGLYGELADVYMMLHDRESAERSLAMMRSLDGKTTKADADKALNVLEDRYARFQAHGKVRTGVLYDSNANMGPRSNTMDLGDLRVNVDGAKEKETFGAYLGADLDLGWRVADKSAWWLVGDVQTYIRGNSNVDLHDSRSRASEWGRAAFGVRHLTASTLTDVRMKAEIFDYEFFQNVSAVGPEGTFLWAVTPSVHLITRGGIDYRDYSRADERNGAYGWAGEYARFFFGGENHEFVVGARYLGASADDSDFSYNGWEGSARFLFKLPYGFELGPFVSFTQEFYNGPATALEDSDREDDRWRVGSTVTYRINEAWSVEGTYQYTNNDSNSGLYDYDQHFTSLGVAWNF